MATPPAQDEFERAFLYVLGNEGTAFTDAAADRGGCTRYGITQATLAVWRGTLTGPQDVRALTLSEAKAIYKMRYWQQMSLCMLTHDVVATAVLDTGVLCGVRAASLLLQECLGVSADGAIGPVTIRAANEADQQTLLPTFAYKLMSRHLQLAQREPTQRKWLYGWLCRASKMLALLAPAT